MNFTTRSRWAAVGAAIAITLGAGGIGITHATTDAGDGPVSAFFPIEPCRLAENVPIGPDTSITLDGWGTTGNCDLPTDTTGLAANVTAVNATQQTNLRFYAQGDDVPGTANLNPSPGAAPTPNAVNITLNTTNGAFGVYNRFGTVAVYIDIMGYYDDHTHDDRYYTETEVDDALAEVDDALAEVDDALADKADTADVYTRTQADGTFLPIGDITMSHAVEIIPNFAFTPTAVEQYANLAIFSGDGIVQIPITGPQGFGDVGYQLVDVTYCIEDVTGGPEFVTEARVRAGDPNPTNQIDGTDRTTDGCYSVAVNAPTASSFFLTLEGDGDSGGGADDIWLTQVESTWAPVDPDLPVTSGTGDVPISRGDYAG